MHEPAICGYDSLIRRPRHVLALSASFTTGPLVASQDPLWLLLGGSRVGVLTGNERYVFPPACPAPGSLRGVLGAGGQMLLKVDIFVFVCTAGFVYK